jgi:fumarate reductase flavoprotein subunit
MKPLAPYLFSLLVVLLITNCDTSTNSPETRYKPGTYTARAKGFVNNITVSVTFSEDKITDITIDEHHETIARPGVVYAIENIPEHIVQKQSVEVDVISGATATSRAIKEAVKNCILEAMNDA